MSVIPLHKVMPLSDPGEANNTSLYQDWQEQILAGNEHFENEDLVVAISCYRSAIAIAEDLIKEHENFRIAIVSLIVSFHNLSDVYLMMTEKSKAERELKAAHDRLIGLQSEYPEDFEKQEALMWGLRRTYTALLLHLKKYSENKIVAVPQMPVIGMSQSNLMN